jgi:hypothetical protein
LWAFAFLWVLDVYLLVSCSFIADLIPFYGGFLEKLSLLHQPIHILTHHFCNIKFNTDLLSAS